MGKNTCFPKNGTPIPTSKPIIIGKIQEGFCILLLCMAALLFLSPQRGLSSVSCTIIISICVPWPNKYYWNIFGSSPVYMTDEYMVNFTEASFLVSYREQKGKIPDLAQEWALNIKEDDNPCLYFYKLKN